MDAPVEPPAQGGGLHDPAVVPLESEVLGLQPLPGQVVGHTAYILGDRHAVVIEDDQQLLAALSGVGQPLVGQPAGEGTVPDQGQHLIVLPQLGPGPGHAQSHGHGVGGVSGHKGVVDALAGLGKAGDAAELPQMGHLLPPSGEDLMHIALVAHIKDQPVPGGVEHPVDGHGQLHRAKVGGQMPAGAGDIVDQLLPQPGAQLLRLAVSELGQQRCAVVFFIGSQIEILPRGKRPASFTTAGKLLRQPQQEAGIPGPFCLLQGLSGRAGVFQHQFLAAVGAV